MFLCETNTHTLSLSHTYTCCKSFPVLWLILFLIHNATQLLLLQHLLLIQIPTIFVQFFLYLTFIRPYVHICSYILCCMIPNAFVDILSILYDAYKYRYLYIVIFTSFMNYSALGILYDRILLIWRVSMTNQLDYNILKLALSYRHSTTLKSSLSVLYR